MYEYIKKSQEWGQKTFPNGTWQGTVQHLVKEIEEVRQEPTDAFEWADLIILAIDGSRRAGVTPEALYEALEEKYRINVNRDWPKPEDQVPGKPVEHIRT